MRRKRETKKIRKTLEFNQIEQPASSGVKIRQASVSIRREDVNPREPWPGRPETTSSALLPVPINISTPTYTLAGACLRPSGPGNGRSVTNTDTGQAFYRMSGPGRGGREGDQEVKS